MPSAYLKLILQAAEQTGVPSSPLLQGTGLAADPVLHRDQPVRFEDALRVLRNSERLLGAGWHLEVGKRLTIPAHGALGFAVVTAPDLGSSLDVLLRFMSLRAPFLWSAGGTEDAHFVFRFFDAVAMGDQRQTLIELAALSLQGLIERPLGHEIRGARLALACDTPSYAEAVRAAFHCEVVYGADRHTLHLPADWLPRPCAMSDEAMHRYLVHRCEEELAAGAGRMPAEVAVRQALLAQPDSIPSLADVARSQHCSPRTLIRRLKQGGTSFQAIRDDVCRTLARDYLRNSDLPVSRIAWRLGYQEPSNFSRAFRRWHGVSPRAYRDAQRSA